MKSRDAIAPAAERAGADLVVKAASSHSGTGRRLLKTSDWTLLRNSHCPVYLVKSILADDIEEMEGLGILELDEEDVALCSYICLSKTNFGYLMSIKKIGKSLKSIISLVQNIRLD